MHFPRDPVRTGKAHAISAFSETRTFQVPQRDAYVDLELENRPQY
jgi:hypothetical protein